MARPSRRRKATSERNFGMTNKFDRIHTNTNKQYIIRNCPARLPKSGFCIEAPKKKAYLCQNCTDCVVKCIKSKLDYLKCYINNDDLANLNKMNEIIDSTLKLLNIQEVE